MSYTQSGKAMKERERERERERKGGGGGGGDLRCNRWYSQLGYRMTQFGAAMAT